MPTYEFRCPEGHDFERFYGKISDAPGELECPVCGAVAARRISGGAGLLFKGSGFYITDYGKDGKKDLKAAPQGDAGKGASGGEGAGSGGTGPSNGASGGSGAASGAASGGAAPAKPAGGE